MSEASIEQLNERFGQQQRVHFSPGLGGLPRVNLEFDAARAEIYLQGAHITQYQPRPNCDALWMSDSAGYQPGKALRGGIPLCWPWFGAATESSDRPQHGYARNTEFSVISTLADATATTIVFRLGADRAPYTDWRHKLQLEFEVRLADSLWMELRSSNLTDAPLTLSQALHSYFAISARTNVMVPALTGLDYLDKLQDYRKQQQTCAIEIDAEIDRVYLDPPATIRLRDRGRDLDTTIESWGNNNLVVWNPGAEKALQMTDFDDLGYQRMLCLEPANALSRSIILEPGECHRLGQRITLTDFKQD